MSLGTPPLQAGSRGQESRLERAPEIFQFRREEYLSVKNLGMVGAGGGMLVPFPGVRIVRVPRPVSYRPGDEIVSVVVKGDSLLGDGIWEGDKLVCRCNFQPEELKQGRLVVAQVGEWWLVKHFYLEDHGEEGLWVRLESRNDKYQPEVYPADQVVVRALVLESVRQWY